MPERSSSIAVAELLAATDYPDIVRWVHFPQRVDVVGDAGSSAVYVYDRCDSIWHWVDLRDQNYGGHSLDELDVLLDRCYILWLVENPRCSRRSDCFLAPGEVPQAVAGRY